ncbi:MAG: hypothetical protein ACYC8S_02765 [Minisyncoccota bacterium]
MNNIAHTIEEGKHARLSRILPAWLSAERFVIIVASVLAVISTLYFFYRGDIVAYGDAESHLNIAKRVVDSLTPGFAQLGGIWLPLPHLFLIPFVYFDWFWKTGIAGSIVSGIAYVVSGVFLYRLALILTRSSSASVFAALVFLLNPNILYLQSTPMTELTLIVFFILSSYFFIRFIMNDSDLLMLILAAFFGFCASLSRYDGWGLVLMEAGILFLYYLPYHFEKGTLRKKSGGWGILEGRLIIFSSLAFLGIGLWLLWGFLILGDPLYFTHSQFSANSQQTSWLAQGELPAYHHLWVAFVYYFRTSIEIMGTPLALVGIAGAAVYTMRRAVKYRLLVLLVLLVPFIFNVSTLFLGQSVIFLPSITPPTFSWTLFNVRYGVMMVPFFALFAGYLFSQSKRWGRALIAGVVVVQAILFLGGFAPVLAYQDGVAGLSSAVAKIPDAQTWFAKHYDGGLVLTDDFARTISIIRTPIKMPDVIYVGNKPYWSESLVAPEKYARWIVMQKNDEVWKNIFENPATNARLYKYFNKVYTSEDVLIFRRIGNQGLN